MKKGTAIGMITLLVIGIVFMGGCTGTGSPGRSVNATPTPLLVTETATLMPSLTPAITTAPPPTPEPTPVPAPSHQDPLVGSWENGMVFHADGTVGSEGYTSWKVNRNQNHSYFVITDMPKAGEQNQRNITSAEWIYNPFSDRIYQRGTSATFSRELPVTLPPAIPAGTTIPTPETAVPTTEGTTAITAVPTTQAPVVTTTAVPTTQAPVATTTAVPTTQAPVATTPTTQAPVATTTAVPTTQAPVATRTAVPVSVEDGTGSLFIRTGGVGSGVTVFIVREGTNVLPVNNVFDPFGVMIESQVSGYVQVKILPDGCSERVSLPAGNYIAYLPDKYGGEPEQQSFTIYKDNITTISFLALSYRASSGGGCGG